MTMMLLQYVQRLAQECGDSGAVITTVGLTGQEARLLSWVQQAWTEIQTKHADWEWLRSSALAGGGISFTTVAGQAVYPLGTGAGTVGVTAANFGKWARGTFRTYPTSVGFTGETILDDNLTYDEWRDTYMYGSQRSVQTRPVAVTVGPAKQLCLGPPPNALYTITGDYFTAPTQMAADADTPTNLPTGYDLVIIYLAMTYYAAYEAAPEVMDRGVAGYSKLMNEMEAKWLPQVDFAGCL